MNRLETADILAVLKAAYPQFYNGLSPKEANKIVDLWAEMFKDEPVMVVAVAVKAMIASRTNTFPPNIGEVKEQITKMRMPKEMTAAEAWTLVYRAIANSGYNAKEEYDRLPPACRFAAAAPGMGHDERRNSAKRGRFQLSALLHGAHQERSGVYGAPVRHKTDDFQRRAAICARRRK